MKPMDVYSSAMDIPFDVAAYCRGHKFSMEAVELGRAIRGRHQAKIDIEIACQEEKVATDRYEQALKSLREKMEREPS